MTPAFEESAVSGGLADSVRSRHLLRVVADSILDPQVLLEAVRDSQGQVVDFVYVEVNQATCEYLGLSRDDLLGHKLLSRSPGIAEVGLFVEYVRCLDTGESVVHNDFNYDNEILGDSRRYDIRASRATSTSISLTWRDVTERFQMARDAARADALYRRSMDSAAVCMCLADLEGNFVEVNDALCGFFGYDVDTLRHKTWQELTAADYLEADLDKRNEVLAGGIESYRMTKQFIHADGHLIWGDLSVSCIRDASGGVEMFIGQITDINAEVAAIQQYKLLAENAGDLVVHIRDGRFAWVSPSCTDVIGGSPDYWVDRDATEIVVPEEGELITNSTEAVESGGVVQVRHRVQALDGTIHWVHVHAKPFYAPDGREDGITAALRVVDDEVAAEEAADVARRQQAAIDARYRRSIDNAAVGMCMVTPEGVLYDANIAMCRFFGFDADEINGRNWKDFTAPAYLEAELGSFNGILEGRIDSYRIIKPYHHRDGHALWGYLSVSGIRDGQGTLEYMVALITDITAQVEADERNRALSEVIQQQSERLISELSSAAAYVSSILPGDLDGPVRVSARYLPSQELAGDIFDYRWIDDDHLFVYLIDVSGHGIGPALLSVSIHNMLRSGSLPLPTLLTPGEVLTELNRRFQMDTQDGNYLTMWCGVYEMSTRTLRYANAGAPPAFAITPDATTATELSTDGQPLGMFDDTAYMSLTHTVPPGSRILIYSDGAYESGLHHGHQLSVTDFNKLFTRMAASPLDHLVETLQGLTSSGTFDDDCTLVNMAFD